MDDRAVNATIRKQAHEVEPSAAALNVQEGPVQRFVLREVAVGDRGVDDRNALINDAPAAEIHVPDLAVAHHAVRKSYRLTRGIERRVRIPLQQRPPVRKLSSCNRVTVRGISATPAIEHRKDERAILHPYGRTAALEMSMAKPAGSSDAPPTSPPLTFGRSTYEATFAAVMLPP